MGQVSVSIHGQRYQLACRDGEEARLETLAKYVDEKVKTLAEGLGNVGDSRLFLMAALIVADELVAARDTNARLSGEALLAERLDEAAAEIEHIAERLQSA